MSNATKTHCPADHPYDEANTHVTKRGHRQCRQCRKDRATERRRAAGTPRRGENPMCRKGLHLLTPDNILTWQGKGRQCKACVERARMARNYGITVEEYDALVADHPACPGCKRVADGLYIDHDHRTGEVRGLLCLNCNIALGHVKDDVEVLQNLIAYLGGKR